MKPKKASGKRKNARVEKESERERETDKKNPFCWLRNKTDRVILRHFWQN